MSTSARASLFYGVMLNQDGYEKLSKRLMVKPMKSDDEVVIAINREIQMELIANTMRFKIVWCTQEFSDKEQYGIAVYDKTVHDYDNDRAFKIPSETILNEKWEKLAKTLKISKKPGWHLFTEYS